MDSFTYVLPPEIWIWIFKLAAAEPFALMDTSPLLPATHEERAWTNMQSPSESHRSGYGQRVRTRRALILVNKHFYYLAIGILYEYIVMYSPESLSLFSRTLGHWRRSINLGEEVNPVQSIKCLNLSMIRKQIFPERDDRGSDTSFITSFRLLTNLGILFIGEAMSRDATTQSLVMSEIPRNGCQLRYVSWSGDPGLFDKFPAEMFQYQYMALEVLSIALMALPSGRHPFHFSDLPRYTLPRCIHSISILLVVATF
jgi:hypothetical protein